MNTQTKTRFCVHVHPTNSTGTSFKDRAMNDDHHPEENPEQPVQQIQHSSATARIPDEIGRGVFATAVIVLHGPNEYTIDFIQSLARPNRVAARIILPPVCGEPIRTRFRAST